MALTKTSAGKYVTLAETIDVVDSGGGNAVYALGTAFGSDQYDWENKKITIKIEMTELSAGNAAWDMYVQTSPNGLTTGDVTTPGSGAWPNWVDASANLNTSLNSTAVGNSAIVVADLTDIWAPYMRIRAYSDGTDTQDASQIKITVSLEPVDGDLSGDDLGGDGTTGVGPDPS
tara:strand:- start:1048 stop:1569 length:522 start_codon:yes stop_codon:yes gene_type:complete